MADKMRDQLSPFIADGPQVIELKLVRDASEVEDESTTFKAEMCHQVYGEKEVIFGYKDLKIKLFYSACRLTTYIGIEYSSKVTPDLCDGVVADDVEKPLLEIIPKGYLKDLGHFKAAIQEDVTFKPFGSLIDRLELSSGQTFEYYSCDTHEPNFLPYHERLQAFLMWFVDGASFIDTSDPRWHFFLVFEKYNPGDGVRYAIAGYGTVYEYYAYPEKIRPRISQVLVLPPFQKMGLGRHLVESIYNHYLGSSNVLDITVEDPSDEFEALMDVINCRKCITLPAFSKEKVKQGFSPEMVEEARKSFLMHKDHVRRSYEILRLLFTNRSDKEEYRQYRIEIKRRLYAPFKMNQKRGGAARRAGISTDETQMTQEQQVELIKQMYKEIEECYDAVIQRLKRS
ncbi:unnamed protein product [Darwinula stevensoni]|uniref:Histone acetyltransferase type B catalytic subunit n=1 Tax=Darwinula stevensoni TaxID=69355 RepID=A0A7R9A8Z8_9CRUS|nr:unnamed protein product [Darwinula stevensoni]CAG0896904.1 unnamed protein product [Darwinula stevensoni]